MTKLLYLDDSYLKECTATVLHCIREQGRYAVTLDQTVLYPTGGGQPHDTGSVNGIRVHDVIERDGVVMHVTDTALQVGESVTVTLDWPRRFDYMQQHCGEHLLSFAAKELYNALNVGFHMAEDYCTVDFNIPLETEQQHAIERRANALIWANLPVEIQYVTSEELETMTLRKKAKGLTGNIRIISMPDADSCTCCGTHVRDTGEIGAIKITGAEHYKGGERLTFACGARALLQAQQTQRIAESLAKQYSCKAEDVPAAAEKQQQELAALKRDNKMLYNRLTGYLQAELLAGTPEYAGAKLCVRLVEIEAAQLRPLALSLCQGAQALALLTTRSGQTLQYVLCCSDDIKLDMGELAQAVNAALAARGGGRGTLAQGSAPYSPNARETLAQLENYLSQILRART